MVDSANGPLITVRRPPSFPSQHQHFLRSFASPPSLMTFESEDVDCSQSIYVAPKTLQIEWESSFSPHRRHE